MHPILFRVPLPSWPLRLWWLLLALLLLSAATAVVAQRRQEPTTAWFAAGSALVLAVAAWLFRDVQYLGRDLPIFAYGSLLGVGVLGGWLLSLRFGAHDAEARDALAHTLLIAAACGLLGARLLYVLCNVGDELSWRDVLRLRQGGFTWFGGLLGGGAAVWWRHRHAPTELRRLGDALAPGVLLGLVWGRLGCYLFGCDFGARLGAGAPAWLQRLGTFPRWQGATLDAGEGSAAFLRHRELLRGTPEGQALLFGDASLPVHPTQLYEALGAALLLGFLLWRRRRPHPAGQLAAIAGFGYCALRFVVDFVRDELEQGTFGPALPRPWAWALGLLVLGLCGAWTLSARARGPWRLAAQGACLLPAVIGFVAAQPAPFTAPAPWVWTVSQWLSLACAVLAAWWLATPADERGEPAELETATERDA